MRDTAGRAAGAREKAGDSVGRRLGIGRAQAGSFIRGALQGASRACAREKTNEGARREAHGTEQSGTAHRKRRSATGQRLLAGLGQSGCSDVGGYADELDPDRNRCGPADGRLPVGGDLVRVGRHHLRGFRPPGPPRRRRLPGPRRKRESRDLRGDQGQPRARAARLAA